MICQSFGKSCTCNMIDHCIVVCAVNCCCFYLVLCGDLNDKYFISVIAHSGDYRDAHAIGQGLHHILLLLQCTG